MATSDTSDTEDPVDKYILKRARKPEDGGSGQQREAQNGATSRQSGKQETVTTSQPSSSNLIPVGVVVVDDDATVNMEVNRLLRQPRYFDEHYNPGQAITCWRCGKRGHLSRDCTSGATCKPCYLCAQYGHEAKACPYRLCYKCGQAGHVANDCANSSLSSSAVCLRCGTASCPCAGRGDAYRYQVGCTQEYTPEDMKHVRCVACGQLGHTCCAPCPSDVPPLTCCNCGGRGHSMAQCTGQMQKHLAAEKMADLRRARERQQQQQYQQYQQQQQQHQQQHHQQQQHQWPDGRDWRQAGNGGGQGMHGPGFHHQQQYMQSGGGGGGGRPWDGGSAYGAADSHARAGAGYHGDYGAPQAKRPRW